MKYVKISLLMLMMSLACGLTSSFAAKSKQPLDKIVAVVNQTVITQSELDEAMQTATRQFSGTQATVPPLAVMKKQVLEQLINRKLQLDLAEQSGIKITDEEIEQAIGKIAANNKMSREDLYEKVASQGLSRSAYHKEIREEMTLQRVQQQAVNGKINLTPQDVDDFMKSSTWQAYSEKEYHLEDILIALPDTPTPEDISNARKHAEAILVRLHHGLNFHEAAASESGNSHALQGGDLGWRKLPEIPTAFANQLTQMKENDLMGPIQTSNGFHVVQVAGIRNVGMKGSAKEQHKQVEALLYQRKYEEALQSWLSKIRSESFINIYPS